MAMPGLHNALPGRRRDKQRHACEGRGADENGADDGERLRQPSEGMPISGNPSILIARDGRRHGKEQPDQDADQGVRTVANAICPIARAWRRERSRQ